METPALLVLFGTLLFLCLLLAVAVNNCWNRVVELEDRIKRFEAAPTNRKAG